MIQKTIPAIIEVDAEIALHPPDNIFSQPLFTLVRKNKDYLSRFLDWPQYTLTTSDTIKFINESALSHSQGNSKTYIVCFQQKVVGTISLHQIEYNNKSAEIGYWLDNDHQGQGIITRSVNALISCYAHHQVIRRFVIKCSVSNISSNRVAQRCGFSHEGVLRQAVYINGHFHDHNLYAKIVELSNH